MSTTTDVRLLRPRWRAASPGRAHRVRVRLALALALPLAVFYLVWLLSPERVGHPVLYGVLVAAELFNLTQAIGFWWTCARERSRPPLALHGAHGTPAVDVFIPVYNEPLDVVEPTVTAALRLRGARVNVWVLDDGRSDELRAMAARHGAGYIRRRSRGGAKAGNINNALRRTSAPFVVVLDCDHVPDVRLLSATLGHLATDDVAFVQTPQYYANWRANPLSAAAWAQQALFFGAIARGKDGHGVMFCCGTNVVFRRTALESVGGFPEGSLTEDFQLSVHLHEAGWRSAYVSEVLARGLGPEDMASYVGQQHRWARGCLGALPSVLRARLPLRARVHYALSCMFFLSGWTVLAYMAFPAIRILTGAQPLDAATSDQFLLHFAPYFGLALYFVALAGGGAYTFRALALQTASFWIGIHASLLVLARRRGSFKVTPKRGAEGRQPRAVLPGLAMMALLAGAAVYGLVRGGADPGTLNNVAFAGVHVAMLAAGVAPALRGAGAAAGAHAGEDVPRDEPREARAA
jgi:cellulose synthase (UDP-forming)